LNKRKRNVHAYIVGQLYHPGRTRWPEAAQYDYRSGQHELVMFWSGISPGDIQAVKRGTCEFEMVELPPVIFLLYRINGACDWSDQPYSWHLLAEDERMLPPPGPGRALMQVRLVACETGILRAQRLISLKPRLTQRLHAAIRRQAAAPWPGDEAYDNALSAAYRQYPTAEALLACAKSQR